jgi:hypothetical protein
MVPVWIVEEQQDVEAVPGFADVVEAQVGFAV